MTRAQSGAFIVFAIAVAVGTGTDVAPPGIPNGPTVLAGDFHVHAMPGDGILPVWEIQREAGRRGLGVVGITNHNDNFAMRIARRLNLLTEYPIVMSGEELTTRGFHMAAIGVETMVDPELTAREAIASIHAQGGVAIAAHPETGSWLPMDPETLRGLDGVEVAHPLLIGKPDQAEELERFLERARRANPDIAPIGSTDYHGGGPLGVCRTYLLVEEVSASGVLTAIRHGRTVASGPGDRLIGSDENVAAVRSQRQPPQRPDFFDASRWPALVALLSLGVLVLSDRPPSTAVSA